MCFCVPVWELRGGLQSSVYKRQRVRRRPLPARLTLCVRFTPNSGHRVDYERLGSKAAARGKITLISVNSPGSVSTSSKPACFLDDDVVADRVAEAGALSGRLGRNRCARGRGFVDLGPRRLGASTLPRVSLVHASLHVAPPRSTSMLDPRQIHPCAPRRMSALGQKQTLTQLAICRRLCLTVPFLATLCPCTG